MSFYTEQVVPRLVLLACGVPALRGIRTRTAAGLGGVVLEIGFGSGLNLPHYPSAVSEILAVEPSATSWRLAHQRIAGSSAPVVRVGLDGQSIPVDDECCDSALCTFTLCTVPDPTLALGEVYRILKPGGRLHLLEHGAAPDVRVARSQRRLEPIQRRLADGCHLTRDPHSLVTSAGFEVIDLEQRYGGRPHTINYLTRLVAERPTG